MNNYTYYKTSYSDNISYYNINNNNDNKIYNNYSYKNTYNNTTYNNTTYNNINSNSINNKNIIFPRNNIFNNSYNNNMNISNYIIHKAKSNNEIIYDNNIIFDNNLNISNNIINKPKFNNEIIYDNNLYKTYNDTDDISNLYNNNDIYNSENNIINKNTFSLNNNNNKITINRNSNPQNLNLSNPSTQIITNNNNINNIYINNLDNNFNNISSQNINFNINKIKIDNSNYLNKNTNNFSQYNRSKTQIISSPSSLSLDNKNGNIEQTTINLVLSNTIEQYFVLKDFLELKSEKDILKYFYLKEKLCLDWLNKNFPKEEDSHSKIFFNNLILNTIRKIYQNIEEYSKIRKSVQTKIDNIIEEIEINKNFNNLEIIYQKIFGLKHLPKFLTNKIDKKIENIQYLEKYRKNYEQMNNIYELNQMLAYYYGFIRGEMKPFNIGYNTDILLMILLYSNLKDIYKSKKIKKIFIDNYETIIKTFNLIYDKN